MRKRSEGEIFIHKHQPDLGGIAEILICRKTVNKEEKLLNFPSPQEIDPWETPRAIL